MTTRYAGTCEGGPYNGMEWFNDNEEFTVRIGPTITNDKVINMSIGTYRWVTDHWVWSGGS